MRKSSFNCILLICLIFGIILCFVACDEATTGTAVPTASATPGQNSPFPSGGVIELPEETFTTPDITPSNPPSAAVTPEETVGATQEANETVLPTKSPDVTSTHTPNTTSKPPQTTAPTTAPTKTPKPSGGVMLPPDYL